jgi:LCP family protein required for cell wall assembly
VLGGDNGFRTDAIIVVGVDPVARTLAMASIPRDTIDVPLPGGGILAKQKINTFYDLAAANPTQYPQGPGRATADMVGALLGIHIDYYAATTFGGFTSLVQAMDGVTITLAKAVVDPFYQITTTLIGVSFPKGTQRLSPSRALIFVRTRQGDNDFERERRQQLFLLAAGRQLVAKPALLAALAVAAEQGNLKTDFPLGQMLNLMSTVGSVDASAVRGAVLGPSSYESAASCICGYALEPNLPAMRKLARLYFPWAVTP